MTTTCNNCHCESHCDNECMSCRNDVCQKCNCEKCEKEEWPGVDSGCEGAL